MIGVYDFCGHYEWTFEWLQQQGGHELVRTYWDEAIFQDSQRHARELILSKGIAGMAEYWQHTLTEEAAGWHCTKTADTFRIDMHECPSKGFLLRNHLEQHADYCDHCMGWVGPLIKEAGFVIDHQHNHCGQCWWEFRRASTAAGQLVSEKDVRQRKDWPQAKPLDTYSGATDPDDKV